MKNKIFIHLICSLSLIMLGCSNEEFIDSQLENTSIEQRNSGATQISGVGYYADTDVCDYIGQGADFALILSGDLEGCLYVFVEDYDCSPSGTYREEGQELFVGSYNGEPGSFWTNYKFEAKFEGCSEEGFFLGAEIFGRCQHPIQNGSGTGVFEGVKGRLDFKDNVEDGSFPYKGHLKI